MLSIHHRQLYLEGTIMKLGTVESRFVDLVWSHAPITTTGLVKLCAQELDWKRTTTYTVLKKFCQRGIFDTTDSLVTVLVTREDYYAQESEDFVSEAFNGSLPAFLVAFTRRKKLSEEEIAQLQRLIDENRG